MKKKLHEAIVAALNDPETRKRMEDVGFEIVANTPEQMAQFQAQELERWKPGDRGRQDHARIGENRSHDGRGTSMSAVRGAPKSHRRCG